MPDRRDRHVQANSLAEGSGPGACNIDHDRVRMSPAAVCTRCSPWLPRVRPVTRVWVRNVTPRRCAAVANPTVVRYGLTKPSRGEGNGFDTIKVQDRHGSWACSGVIKSIAIPSFLPRAMLASIS